MKVYDEIKRHMLLNPRGKRFHYISASDVGFNENWHGVDVDWLSFKPSLSFLGTEMSGVRIAKSSMRTAMFHHCRMVEADFADSVLSQSFFLNVSASKACFAGSFLNHAVFRNVNLNGATFSGADLSYTTFINCDLTGAVLGRTGLQDAVFINCLGIESCRVQAGPDAKSQPELSIVAVMHGTAPWIQWNAEFCTLDEWRKTIPEANSWVIKHMEATVNLIQS